MNPGQRVVFARDAREQKSVTFATRFRCRAISYVQKCGGAGEKPKYTYYRVRCTHRNAVTSAATVISAPSFPSLGVGDAVFDGDRGLKARGLAIAATVPAGRCADRNPPCVTEGQSRFHRRIRFPELETERVT